MGRPKSDKNKLTEAELKIMNILWSKEDAAQPAQNVQQELMRLEDKDYAYTSISTLLRILEKKSFVESKKSGRSHLYSPLLSKQEYQERATKELLENVFENNPSLLVKQLLGSHKTQHTELEEIKKLLKQKGLLK